MDAPGLIVSILGLALIAAVSWLVVVAQRAALVRARVRVLERTVDARRGTVARLAEVARAGWVGDAITVRGTVPIRQGRGGGV